MPLPGSIDNNKTALAHIVAGLFALLGLTAGAVIGRIPKALHRTIIRVLRPAESAARRLIAILAKNIKVKAPKPRPRPQGLARSGQRKPRRSFALFDPLQRFFREPPRPKDQPRPRPRITFFLGNGGHRTLSFSRELPQRNRDGLENSDNIIARLQALKAALENLPRQAMRMARAQARHATSERLKFRKPLRPGPAPGARKMPVHDVDHVLERCHWLAREALAPNTS